MAYFGSDYSALAHHWMYSSDHSHCYGYRMYSEGNRIYSYGSHYVIAEKKDNNVVFVNDSANSKTTNVQRKCVIKAIPRYYEVFYVNNFENYTKNIEYWFDRIQYFGKKLKRARSKKDEYIFEIETLRKTILKFKELFVPNHKFNKAEKEILSKETDVSDLVEKFEKVKKLKEKEFFRKKKKEIKQWLSGEFAYHTNLPMLLRLSKDGKYVESSHSAKMRLKTALGLLKDIKSGNFKKKYDDFDFVSCNKKEIVIGCHHIPMKEVRRFENEIDK